MIELFVGIFMWGNPVAIHKIPHKFHDLNACRVYSEEIGDHYQAFPGTEIVIQCATPEGEVL